MSNKIGTLILALSIFFVVAKSLEGTGKALIGIGEGLYTAGEALEGVTNVAMVKGAAKGTVKAVKQVPKVVVKIAK